MTSHLRRLSLATIPALLLTAMPLAGGTAAPDLSRLPDWAKAAALEGRSAVPPKDAEAWVLLDRTEIAYTGDGEIRVHRLRVVQVLTERGISEGQYQDRGEGASVRKVKKLKGWNLRPDGEIERMDLDDVIAVEGLSNEESAFTSDVVTYGNLDRVVKGSILAFESLEVLRSPMGAVTSSYVMQSLPVLRWEIAVGKKEGWFSDLKAVAFHLDLTRTEGWNLKIHQEPGLVRIQDVPALPKPEPFQPPFESILPEVWVRFLDPALTATPDWSTWDGLAQFTNRAFMTSVTTGLPPEVPEPDPKARLESLLSWMDSHLTYRQVYLNPSRGWIPEKPSETGRKRYGDCKDFAAFLLAGARRAGLVAAPVLASINEGRVDPSLPPSPEFNHVITALRLDHSFGFPAEVQTPAGRFLLVDPTDHQTPFGQLGWAHRGRWVMICLPDRAIWVRIPPAAIAPGAIRLRLRGNLDPAYVLTAKLTIEEDGDASGIRSLAVNATPVDFQKWLQGKVLSLPASAVCTLVRQSDPSDLKRPFTLELEIKAPDAAAFDGSEYDLYLPGFPSHPTANPEVRGERRRYPLQSLLAHRFDYEADITLPRPVQPILGSFQAQTPLRTFTWSASGGEAQGKPLHLKLGEDLHAAEFGFDHLQEGVKAFQDDRAAILKLRQDGLAFKIQP